MTDHLDIRRKRILFRSVRRGTRESDEVLGGFARARLATLSDDQLDRLEALLDCSDGEILGWVAETRPVPPAHDNDILGLIKDFKNSLARH